ncbi:hypothetical protein P5V15_007437 [Pogonomyrmex californicus]
MLSSCFLSTIDSETRLNWFQRDFVIPVIPIPVTTKPRLHFYDCYIVPGGKETRGLTVPYGYRLLTSNDQLTENNIRLTRILEFCVEMLQAYSLFLEDIDKYYTLELNIDQNWYPYRNSSMGDEKYL